MPPIPTENRAKAFLSAALPAFVVMWLVLLFYGNYMIPTQFQLLPQAIREQHIISLFFRADSWYFPLSLTKNISPPVGYPLALSDSIPLMAMILKLFGAKSTQYFGVWLFVSFALSTVFAYRITRRIFQDDFLCTCLGTLLFIFMPFAWYHPYWTPWAAGQWTTLWAVSLFFQKRRHLSNEWFALLILSAFIHPFFILTNLLIGIADIMRLYLYKHRISAIRATVFFGNILSISVVSLLVVGTFFTQTYSRAGLLPPPLVVRYLFSSETPTVYSASYIYPGVGIFLGLLPTPFIALLNPAVKYIKRYHPLILCFFVLFVLSLGGGVVLRGQLIRILSGDWGDYYIWSILSSGARFFTPILWVLPILVLQNAAWLNKIGWKKVSLVLLLGCVLAQISQFQLIFPESESQFESLTQQQQNFLDRDNIVWIQSENAYEDVPYFEKIAYFAWQEGKKISAAPVIRVHSGHKITARTQREKFFGNIFDPDTIYVIPREIAPRNLSRYGSVLRMDSVIFFKAI
ncbi:MAG: hypothetical protein ACRCY4_02060 [Brevinema sp.]